MPQSKYGDLIIDLRVKVPVYPRRYEVEENDYILLIPNCLQQDHSSILGKYRGNLLACGLYHDDTLGLQATKVLLTLDIPHTVKTPHVLISRTEDAETGLVEDMINSTTKVRTSLSSTIMGVIRWRQHRYEH